MPCKTRSAITSKYNSMAWHASTTGSCQFLQCEVYITMTDYTHVIAFGLVQKLVPRILNSEYHCMSTTQMTAILTGQSWSRSVLLIRASKHEISQQTKEDFDFQALQMTDAQGRQHPWAPGYWSSYWNASRSSKICTRYWCWIGSQPPRPAITMVLVCQQHSSTIAQPSCGRCQNRKVRVLPVTEMVRRRVKRAA